MRRLALLIILVGGMALAASYIYAQDDGEPTYVGSRQCFACHRDAGRAHLESRHALTLQEASDEALVADFDQGADIRTVQFPGEDTPRPFTPDDIAWVVGTGRYFQRYVYEVEEGNFVLLPAEWNAVQQVWQPYTPAEEWPSEAYNWTQNCAGCHVTGMNEGVWKEEGVQCEACHGPGSAHVEAVKEGGNNADEAQRQAMRDAIVLSPDAQICGQCHSQGTNGDLLYPTGYQPGESLQEDGGFSLVAPDDPAHWWPSGHARQKYMQFNEWLESSHASSVTNLKASEGAQDACLICHSVDYAWAAVQPAEGEEGAALPEPVTLETAQHGVTCSSCHTIHAAAGEDDEAAQPDFLLSAEPYTMCVTCHRDTDVTENVHHPVQEMYEGLTLVDQVPGVPSAHFTVENGPTCTTCHMPRVPVEPTNRASHLFKPVMPGAALDVEALQDTCSVCHANQVDAASLQALIDDVQADTSERLAAAQAALTAESPAWITVAIEFVAGDGSLGVHNYIYADALLDAVEAELGLNETGDSEAQGEPVIPTESAPGS